MPRPSTPKRDGASGHTASPEELAYPGAGTLFVHGIISDDATSTAPPRRGISPRRSPARRAGRSKESARSRSRSVLRQQDLRRDEPRTWDDIVNIPHQPVKTISSDRLLERGIDGYTFVSSSSGGVLGRGKFSSVYKVLGPDGKFYALKHTPLHPHHPLIAARLLREPTLLSQIPPHPCLIGVEGWARTAGHFYLIEQYASHHTPLPSHPLPLLPSRAAYILDQMVSVIRDGLHEGGRVVHRDLKGDNILVDIDTGEIVILDLGLATHFSMSEPKLTTCCGSPAFHSPEIVQALGLPPGEVSYYGPELDIWCIALTLLSLLLEVRFPLGPSHKSLHVMRERVLDRLQELDEKYPPSAPWRVSHHSESAQKATSTPRQREFECREWRRVRAAMRDFLEIDGRKRMRKFAEYTIGEETQRRVSDFAAHHQGRVFKTTSFLPTDIKYTLPLYLDSTPYPHDTAKGETSKLILLNPTGETERRVVSYFKYLFRSKGILYHCVSFQRGEPTIIQLVLTLPSDQAARRTDHGDGPPDGGKNWVSNLLSLPSLGKRSSSVPAKAVPKTTPPLTTDNDGAANDWVMRCWIKIEVESPAPGRRARLRSRSRASHAPGVNRGSSVDTGSGFTARSNNAPNEGEVLEKEGQNGTEVTVDSAQGAVPVLTSSIGGAHGLTTLPEGKPHTARPTAYRSMSVESTMSSRSSRHGGTSTSTEGDTSRHSRKGPGNGLNRTPSGKRPHPLSRQVSLESNVGKSAIPAPSISNALAAASSTSINGEYIRSKLIATRDTTNNSRFEERSGDAGSRGIPRVIVHLSDERMYDVLYRVLDVEQDEELVDENGALVSPTLSSIRDSYDHTIPLTPVTPSVDIFKMSPSPRTNTDRDHDDEAEERGRPRSKEDPRLSVSTAKDAAIATNIVHDLTAKSDNVTVDLDPVISPYSKREETSQDKVEQGRGRRRGGLLDGWFGFGAQAQADTPASTTKEAQNDIAKLKKQVKEVSRQRQTSDHDHVSRSAARSHEHYSRRNGRSASSPPSSFSPMAISAAGLANWRH